MERKQSRNSRLVGIPGLICLLAMALTASYFHVQAAGALLLVLFFMASSSYAWSKGICRRVEVEVSLKEGRCHAGDRVTAVIRVKNRSLFPMVWLDVILPVGDRELVCPLREGEENAGGDKFPPRFTFRGMYTPLIGIRQRFVWLLWQQEITWEQPVLAQRRGVWHMAGAGLQAGDGFGLSAKDDWKKFPEPVRLLICPKLVPVHVEPFLKPGYLAEPGNRGQMEDITILKSSRPYTPGDPVKRINWRLLARSGRLEVNQYERIVPGCTAFLLDLETFTYIRKYKDERGEQAEETVYDEEAFEAMASRVASFMRELAERGLKTALIVPGYRVGLTAGEQTEAALAGETPAARPAPAAEAAAVRPVLAGETAADRPVQAREAAKAPASRFSRDAVLCVPEDGDDALDVLAGAMEALAMIDYRGGEVSFPYEEFWAAAHRLGSVCICTRTDEKTSLDALAQALGRGRVRFMTLKRGREGADRL